MEQQGYITETTMVTMADIYWYVLDASYYSKPYVYMHLFVSSSVYYSHFTDEENEV